MSTDIGVAVVDAGPTTPDPRRWAALAVLTTSTLIAVLDTTIVNIALPHAQADLHISDVDRQWVVTAYTLVFGGLLLLGGRIADFAGRKRVFVIGLLGFAAASGMGGLAVNEGMLFAARALQGGFAALLAPAALSLVTLTFVEPRERARAFSVYGAVQGGGAAVGLILGGLLTEYVDWRWCLFVNIPIAAVAALAAVPTVRESRAAGGRRYDVPGAILVTAGLAVLVYGFSEAGATNAGWLSGAVLVPIVLGVVLLAAFLLTQTRTAHPLLPLRIVVDRNRGGAFVASLLVSGGMTAMFVFLTYYFQVNLGLSPLTSGLAFMPYSLGIIATSTLASHLVPRIGSKQTLVLGMVAATAGLFWLTRLDSSSTWLVGVLPAELALSVGLGLVFVAVSAVALSGIAARDAGVASAMRSTAQQIGGSLGVALLNTLYASAVSSWHGKQLDGFLNGYRIAFMGGDVMFALALLVFVFVIRTRKTRAPGVAP